MTSYCTQCGATLPPQATECANCAWDTSVDSPLPGYPKPNWGIATPILGLLALIPTALLVASFALLIPLPIATVVSATALGALQLVLVWILAFRTWPPALATLGLSRPATSWPRTGSAMTIAIVGSLGFAQVYAMAVTALGWEILAPPELPGELLLPGPMVIFSVLALAIWTPLAEEVFFRGFVMRGMINRWGPAPAVVISAAVFAALHFEPALLLPVFVIGLLLGGLYWYTKSIWPCIAVHAVQNLVAVTTVAVGT